jgi:hypothetical protein
MNLVKLNCQRGKTSTGKQNTGDGDIRATIFMFDFKSQFLGKDLGQTQPLEVVLTHTVKSIGYNVDLRWHCLCYFHK